MTVAFTLTYIDPAGVHHEQPTTAAAASQKAAWRKVVAAATAKDADVPRGWKLLFVRWEP